MFKSFKVKQAAHNVKVQRQAKGKSVLLPKVCLLLQHWAGLKTLLEFRDKDTAPASSIHVPQILMTHS